MGGEGKKVERMRYITAGSLLVPLPLPWRPVDLCGELIEKTSEKIRPLCSGRSLEFIPPYASASKSGWGTWKLRLEISRIFSESAISFAIFEPGLIVVFVWVWWSLRYIRLPR